MISVCIPTFNGEKYISEQLNSILPQLSNVDELIISDDGSTDRTCEIIQEFAIRDARIHLIKGPQKGVIANVSHAISQTKGALIFLADQDDVWLANKVAVIKNYFSSHPKTNVVVSDLVIVDATLQPIHPSYFQYRKAKSGWLHNLIRSNYIGAGMVFRSSLKEQILPIPVNIPMHDMWIGLLGGKKVDLLWEPLTLYRRHGDNVSEIRSTSTFIQKLKWRVCLIYFFMKNKLRKKKV